jgi:hypothetical protein
MSSVSRRTLLRGLTVFGLAASASKVCPAVGAAVQVGPRPTAPVPRALRNPTTLELAYTDGTRPPPSPPRLARIPIVVSLALPSGSVEFSESNATELSPYVKATINQKIKVLVQEDWRVYFRPEGDGSREEVVVEYGKLFGPTANIGAYIATITQGSKTLATVKVPAHYFMSRWRWQSAPRPIVGNISQLKASGLLPPIGTTGIVPVRPNDWVNKPYTVMGNAGITLQMGGTGEREDIGLITEHQARSLFGDTLAMTQTMAQGEAGGSMPLHWRDQNTGKPISIIDRPEFDTHQNNRGQTDNMDAGTSPWQLERAHFPSVNYVPYLLTNDLYHLEELQFQAAWAVSQHKWGRTELVSSPHAYEGQERAWAWTLRTLFQASKATPASVPECLLPKSYFDTILASTLAFLTADQVSRTDKARSLFGVWLETDNPSNVSNAFWQGSMLCGALGWGVLMGFTSWQPVLNWKLLQTKGMLDGHSGWNRWAFPYYYNIGTSRANQYQTWAAMYAAYAAANPSNVPGTPNVLYTPDANGDVSYPSYARGALVLAIKAGRTDLGPVLDWYHTQIKLQSARINYGIAAKWSFVK